MLLWCHLWQECQAVYFEVITLSFPWQGFRDSMDLLAGGWSHRRCARIDLTRMHKIYTHIRAYADTCTHIHAHTHTHTNTHTHTYTHTHKHTHKRTHTCTHTHTQTHTHTHTLTHSHTHTLTHSHTHTHTHTLTATNKGTDYIISFLTSSRH